MIVPSASPVALALVAKRQLDPALIAAGDIAGCRQGGDTATLPLIRHLDGTIATLGDNAYRGGAGQEFADCYDPAWGSESHYAFDAPLPASEMRMADTPGTLKLTLHPTSDD
jgi:hypothetical protein